MNLARSIRVALAQRDHNAAWLADKIGVKRQQIGRIIKTGNATTTTVDKIAKALELSSSELIALGEGE